jgi:hypothetical protein
LDDEARTVAETVPPIAADQFRGGSQLIAFDSGWLALVHEARVRDGQRHYRHRFVWFDEAARLRGVSRPFFFQKRGVEFAAGLAWHPDGKRLVVTYGVEDSEAWIATLDAGDVKGVLEDAAMLRSGDLETRSNAAVRTAPKTPAATQSSTLSKGPSSSRLHFIVGVPRSGTTLFRSMLGAHPMICAPSETPWLSGAYGAPPSLRELLRNLIDAGDGPVKNIQSVAKADVRRAARLFVLELFATKMQKEGKEILVLKTPDDIWFIDELIDFFPHAQILHLRRDVRDVALSTVDTGFPTLNHFGNNNFGNAVGRWITCETKIQQIAKRHTNIHSFRFEDLVTHPRAELERAAGILGVPFAPRMLDYALHLTDTPEWEAGSRSVMRQRSLNATRAWAHRSLTPTAEQRQVIEENAKRIEALGYPGSWHCESHPSQLSSKERLANSARHESPVATIGASDQGLLLNTERPPSDLEGPASVDSDAWPSDELTMSGETPSTRGDMAETGGSSGRLGSHDRETPSSKPINLATNAARDLSERCSKALSVTTSNHLFTVHGTVLYVDTASGELRHGPPHSSPINASLVSDGAYGQIECDTAQPIVCLRDRCQTVESASKRGGPSAPTILEVVSLESRTVGLRAAGVYLCAEADGRVTLSRRVRSEWEKFRLSANTTEYTELASESTKGSVKQKFLQLAPFLRAADSPQERRKLSREFDARIGQFLGRNGVTLPQIHLFYEVQSEKAEHRTLIAATTSMRAAGHPVRVWSYAPNKLEFLRSHGVEISAAEEVVPRGLFERIVAGSEIRYFSDVFRYAVLYEHGGLWMDSDVIMLRPFPFRGKYFFNLQWRSGPKNEHFICGNVMYTEPHSRHFRNLYEMAIQRFYDSQGRVFGAVGPILLSDYIASQAGSELQNWAFSPMFFNAIDWTELDRFDKPMEQLAEYLNDERVFGVHLWTARNAARPADGGAPIISLLSNPLDSFPSLMNLADRFDTAKNRHTGNRHFYSRVYDRLLSGRRFSLRRLMEVGLCRGLAERDQTETPSVQLWQTYFPYVRVIGVDLTDFSTLNNERFKSFICDQSKVDDLRAVAAKVEAGSVDVIIDDGSHASFDEQLTLREFFPLLAEGGWYFIEGLDWQPPGEDTSKITLTKTLLQEIKEHGRAQSVDPLGVSEIAGDIADILFFDSHYELTRAKLLGGLAAIRKRGGTALVQ